MPRRRINAKRPPLDPAAPLPGLPPVEERVVGGRGGTAAWGRSHYACQPVFGLDELRQTGGVLDLVGLSWKLRGDDVEMLAGYLRPSVGLSSSDNKDRLQNWASFLGTLGGNWILFADWNAEPSELRDSGFLDMISTTCRPEVVLPNVEVTSRSGAGTCTIFKCVIPALAA